MLLNFIYRITPQIGVFLMHKKEQVRPGLETNPLRRKNLHHAYILIIRHPTFEVNK